MKIEEKDGKKILVFEAHEADLKASFEQLAAEGKRRYTIAKDLALQGLALHKQILLAEKRYELWTLENHDLFWEPINEAYCKSFGVSTPPPLDYDNATGVLSLDERPPKKEPTTSSGLIDLANLFQGITKVSVLPKGLSTSSEEDEEDPDSSIN